MRREEEIIVIWSRTSSIAPKMIGYIIVVHNRKKYLPIYITDLTVGYKLRDFASALTFTGHKRNDSKSLEHP